MPARDGPPTSAPHSLATTTLQPHPSRAETVLRQRFATPGDTGAPLLVYDAGYDDGYETGYEAGWAVAGAGLATPGVTLVLDAAAAGAVRAALAAAIAAGVCEVDGGGLMLAVRLSSARLSSSVRFHAAARARSWLTHIS